MSVPIKGLPPNAKEKVRYRFVVDVGAHPSTGKRRQVTRTFCTLREAKGGYAHIMHRRYEAAAVPFDARSLDDWLDALQRSSMSHAAPALPSRSTVLRANS
ncbi:Arm DNA-binding domain-containing protein [Streptomyces sp. NPDC096323]|uniref:Arm DNA-binding domain-containing protein n=1 Tax=Streptomyces sp. NPDC096323 TaxID=3155822 RepID=UPI003325BBA6